MKKYLAMITTLALVAVLATGCGNIPWSAHTSTPTGEEANFRFWISDDVNAMEDFISLEICISKIGLHTEGESGGWVEVDICSEPPPEPIDLVKLPGPKAQLIWEGSLEPGTYNKAFIYVDTCDPEVPAIQWELIEDEPGTRVKLPSEKLQINFNEPFEVVEGEPTNFTYDLTVIKAGQSGLYIIKPQVEESGVDQQIIDVQAEGAEEDLEITTTSLDPGMVGEEYEAELEAIGGTGDYEWTLLDGVLPDGLELSLDGEISGTPTTEESQTFTVQVEDEAGETDAQELTITIGAE